MTVFFIIERDPNKSIKPASRSVTFWSCGKPRLSSGIVFLLVFATRSKSFSASPVLLCVVNQRTDSGTSLGKKKKSSLVVKIFRQAAMKWWNIALAPPPPLVVKNTHLSYKGRKNCSGAALLAVSGNNARLSYLYIMCSAYLDRICKEGWRKKANFISQFFCWRDGRNSRHFFSNLFPALKSELKPFCYYFDK